jgi:putative ABC transport system permease protein
MGIRLALGATPTSLVRLVVGQGLMPVLVGVSIGIAGAAVASRFIAGALFEAAGVDWWAMATVVAAVALVACYIPARRVTRIDPAQAIRVE